jgi:predicted dienelactone hydrolase
MHIRWLCCLGIIWMTTTVASPSEPPSRPVVDAPELAHLGPHGVGYRTLTLVHRNQPDPLKLDPTTGTVTTHDRTLVVDLWYPANVKAGAKAESYTASLPSEPPAPAAVFSIPGLAVRNAPAVSGKHPLVVISHGYSNATAALSWLSENLATKGYVVAAIRHEDPDISDRSKLPGPALRRPLDIAFVTATLQDQLSIEGLIDPASTALVGYSMGGYGVLTAAGATLDPKSPLVTNMPGNLLAPYVRGGAEQDALRVRHLKAVVALAPAGGGSFAAWGPEGIADLSVPMLLIAGNQDRTVDYTTGARAFFEGAVHVPRYLLTFREGGHGIGLNWAPEAMRSKLWDFDWFEDPVWRKDRIIAINQHMITAFLDLYVKGDESRRAYLHGLTPDSDTGRWPHSAHWSYDGFSPGDDGVTVWKGFQDRHAAGLLLEERLPEPR